MCENYFLKKLLNIFELPCFKNMARIIYSLAQDGRGHSSRGYEIIRRLAERKHEIMVLTGGDTYDPLRESLRKIKNVSVKRIPGFQSFYNNNGKINYWKTSIKNFPRIICGDLIIKKLETLIEKNKLDFAISDFEPYLPRAAKKKKIGFITIDNQHRILFENINLNHIRPNHLPSYLVSKGVVYVSHPLGRKCIISSVFKPKIKSKKIGTTEIISVGPIIRKEVADLKNKVTKKDFVLVYVKPVLEKAVLPLLEGIKEKFIMYVKNPEDITKLIGSGKNITCKAHSHTRFPKDLAKCKAVITSAGEQLISEALYLGKPLFLLPEGGQFEQILNGYSVKNAGLGDFKVINKVKKDDIKDFLARLDNYEKKIKKMKINNSVEEIINIIEKEIKKSVNPKFKLRGQKHSHCCIS